MEGIRKKKKWNNERTSKKKVYNSRIRKELEIRFPHCEQPKKCQQECKSFFCQMHSCVLTCSQSTTSVSSDPELSVPWTRTSLLNTPTYVASPGFLSQVVWTKSSNQNDLVNAATDSETTDAPSSRATCAVVGCVSPNRLFLEPHGNYNPSFENTALETSKAQFQLVSPTIHPEFDIDFNHGIKNIENIQKRVCKEGPGAEHFVVSDGGLRALKFSWPLFEKRVGFSILSSRDIIHN